MLVFWVWTLNSILEIWRNVEYPFIVMTPKLTLIESGRTYYGPTYRANRSIFNFLYSIRIIDIFVYPHQMQPLRNYKNINIKKLQKYKYKRIMNAIPYPRLLWIKTQKDGNLSTRNSIILSHHDTDIYIITHRHSSSSFSFYVHCSLSNGGKESIPLLRLHAHICTTT